MDALANKVVLNSKPKKGKPLKQGKKKIEKVTSPVQKAKKVVKLKSKKEILKKNLKNSENVDSVKLSKKIKPLKNVFKNKEVKKTEQNDKEEKVVKMKKSQESKQSIKKEGKISEQITLQVKKPKNETTEKVPKQNKKRKNNETETVSEKSKEVPKQNKKRKSNETETVSEKSKKVKIEKESTDENKSSTDVPELQLSLEQVKQGVEAVLKLAVEEIGSSKSLMADEKLPIFLQINNIKIPRTPSRILRMLLPHSLVADDDDVALIVKDLRKGRRTDYEPTVDHFQQLLQEHKCTQIKTVIPMNQIKTEYDQYELKRNLVNSHDFFLIDGRLSGHASRLLGRIFTNKRKLPTSIRMGSKDLKHEIDYALRKTSMQLNSNGDSQIVQIGTTEMPESHIVENIEAACKCLAKHYPGGWANIRSLRLKTPSGLGVPIYMTMKIKNVVKTPDVKPKRPKAYKTYVDELTTTPGNAPVIVRPDGTVELKKQKGDKKKTESKVMKQKKKSKVIKNKKKPKVNVKKSDGDDNVDDNKED